MSPTRHDRESVTCAALDLLDRVGLPDLSMRRLAAELDVQPSALYWHVASKQELLAAVADRILRTVPEPDPAAPLADVARAIRDSLLAYRDGAEVVMSTYALRLGARRAQEALIASLGTDGDEDLADAAFEFILGHAMLLQQRMHAQSIGAVEPDAADPTARSAEVFDAGIRAFAALSAARRPS
ncbi:MULTISPECIES: TetR family transcriptional regulator [Microbacterium]|uniref:TetR family transcriptional regulator n=1 Tax=Microbacterium TaxID=33882 RepID=UPI00217CDDFF|nr:MULTISPECIES: TetR family transcriptional regulator [Microbacterium]UWF76635.1 TetR family transcriptional regulator [Microbacterium neungamense]WCM54784.1 TetR family transcriptional regulator [Microbacterium sp. EF45047]